MCSYKKILYAINKSCAIYSNERIVLNVYLFYLKCNIYLILHYITWMQYLEDQRYYESM